MIVCQYIPCYCSSYIENIWMMVCIRVNTSHVTVHPTILRHSYFALYRFTFYFKAFFIFLPAFFIFLFFSLLCLTSLMFSGFFAFFQFFRLVNFFHFHPLLLSKSFATVHPIVSVSAAVVALIILPTPGSHPINHCVRLLPTIPAVALANSAFATLSSNAIPNTPPSDIIIVI